MSTLEKEQSVLSICSGSQTVDIRAPTTEINNERHNHNHISIHPMQLQQTTCPYESMSFDQSFGLDTANPTYGLNTKFSDFRSSFTSTRPVVNNHQTQNWHLEDSDMLTPLPENMLYGVDLEQIEKINDNELDGIVPVTDQISNNLKVTSEDQPMTKLPKESNFIFLLLNRILKVHDLFLFLSHFSFLISHVIHKLLNFSLIEIQ